MINLKQTCKITLLAVFFMHTAYTLYAADRYSVASGNWNSNSTWSAISGGPPGASVPVAGDNVYIENNHTITVSADAACANITFTGSGATLNIYLSVTLTSTGSVTLDNQSTSSNSCTVTGEGTINCSNIEVGSPANTPVGNSDTYTHTISSSIAYFFVSGNLSINNYYAGFKTAGNGVFNMESGTMTIDGEIRGINQNNKNESTFSMEAGSASATLNLNGATPINLSWNNDVVNLNGSASLVNYSGAVAQTLFNTDYNNITLSGSGAKTFSNQGNASVNGILSMEGTATANGKSPKYGANATLQYKGDAAQATGIEFPNTFSGTGGVIIDNINGLALDNSYTIDYSLSFINGIITTVANTLTLTAGCAVTGAGEGNYVNGTLERGIAAGTTTISFAIGDATAYTPVVLDFTGTTNGTGTITAYTTQGDHPQIGTSMFNPSYTVNRYWSLTNNGVTGFATYNATFNFVTGDLDTGTDYNYLVLGNVIATTWTYPDTGTRTAISTQATGLASFGDFQLGLIMASYRSAGTGDWDLSTSWETFMGGSWIPAPAPPSAASSTVTILSPHTITITSSLTIDEMTIDAGASLIMSSGIDVNDGTGVDMTINGTLDCGGSNIVSGAGSFSLESAANIIIGSPDGITSSGTTGNIQTATRIFDTGASYTYNGTSSQVTGSGLPATVNNLTIANSSGVSLSGSVTITGTLNLTDGILTTGSTTLTFQNSDTPIARSSGTITTDASTNIFFGTPGNTGGTAFTIPSGTFTMTPTINNLTINRDNSLTFGDQMISIAGILLCNGPLITAGNLTLLSDASATALIDGTGTGQVSGNVAMQRYLPVGFGYKYFSSPFQAATVSEFGDDMDLTFWFPTFYEYDENRSTSGWVDYSDPAGVLDPMRGYAVNFGNVSAPNTVDVTGEVNNGALSLTLYNNNNTYTQGMNLVGNPYPSSVDWDAAAGWTKTNIDDAVYYFKASATDEYGGMYSSYINGVSSDGIVSNIIPSMQGFFVHVSDGTYPVTGTLGMDNSVRINDLTHAFTKSASVKKVDSKAIPLIRLKVLFEDDSMSVDPLVIYFHNEASPGFDGGLDALKLLNTDFLVPNLYCTLPDETKLSINALNTDNESTLNIPLGVKTNRSGNIIFRIKDINEYFSSTSIYLKDVDAETNQLLVSGSEYLVYLEQGEYHNRFFLELLNLPTGISASTAPDAMFDIYSVHNLLKTNIYDISGREGILSVFNLTGQVLYRQIIRQPGYYEFSAPALSGIYIVNYTSGMRTFSRKIFIGN